jgi:histidine triad (HIT) family protein
VTDCLFCKIVAGELPADIVYQDEATVAFRDIAPQAPVHVLVVPRRHVANLDDAVAEDPGLVSSVTMTAARVAQQEGVTESGYRCVVNNGEQAQQSVRHLHLHVMGGRRMGWPPG